MHKIRFYFTFLWCIPSAFIVAFIAPYASAADKVVFQLDWLPGGDKAPIYVGLEQGFFAEAGLDVSISQGRGSTDAITKIATGIADIGLCDIVALLAAKAEQDVPVKAVFSVFSKAPYAFFTLADSGIKTVNDVAGKKIATSPFTSANLFLPFLLAKNQINEASIELIKAEPGSLNPMLLTGRTDLIISWITDSVRNRAQARSAGKTLEIIPWHDAGLDFYSTSIIASERFLKARPDVAKRFVQAYAKAIDYTWKHPEQAAAAVNKKVPEVETQLAADTITAIRGLVYNEISSRNGVGTFTTERLADTWQWTATAMGFEAEALDPTAAVDLSFIPEPAVGANL